MPVLVALCCAVARVALVRVRIKRFDQQFPNVWASLPFACTELKARRIFGYGSFQLVRGTFRELCVDFDGNLQGSGRVTGEQADDFFSDLDQTHFCGRRIDLCGTIEGPGFLGC